MILMNSIQSVGILYTRYCPASCRHCGTDAGPWRKGRLPFEVIEKILKNLSNYNIDNLSISGGEPLAFYDDMIIIADMAQNYHITLTIFSNAFWARNYEVAHKYLSLLKKKGLVSLMLSSDEFHQKFINLDNIVIAANTAKELNIDCKIAVPSSAKGWSSFRTLGYLEMKTDTLLYTHPIHPIGRALELDDSYFQWKKLELKGCELVGRVEVDVTGLIAQCPPASDFNESNPLVLGDLNTTSLEKTMEKYQSSLLFWILANYGPLGLYKLFLNGGVKMFIDIDGKISNCQLCQQLTSNKKYFEEFYRLEKIDLQDSRYMDIEYQERCRTIILFRRLLGNLGLNED